MALISCSECGNQVSNKAYCCPNCGNPISKSFDEDEDYDEDYDKEDNDEDLLHCPKCNSTQLSSNKKGFSGGKALTGAVLAGGIGVLAGTIGSGKVIITCLKCGYKFNAGDYEKEKQKFDREVEMYKKIAKGEHSYLGEIFASLFFSIIGFIISYNLFANGWSFFGVIFGIATLLCVASMIFFIYSEIKR